MAKIEAIEKLRGYVTTLEEGHGTHIALQASDLTTCADAIQKEVNEWFVELPKDADGEVIHIGDEIVDSMGERGVVDYIEIRLMEKETYHYVSLTGSALRHPPRGLRHYHKPTVEDVLCDFALACEESGWRDPRTNGVMERFAKRLRLADE